MKNILITGGAGFIGTNLVNKLKNKNQIYVVDLPKKIKKNLKKLKVQINKKDIKFKNTFNKLPKIKFDKVYHQQKHRQKWVKKT